MYAPVQHELFKRQPADFPAYRVETGQEYRFRRVIDDQVYPGDRFEGPDVTAFPTDDPAFHLVAWQMQHTDHALCGLLAGHPLNCLDHDVSGPLLGRGAGVVFDVTDQQRGFALGLALDDLDQLSLGGVGGETGNALELPAAEVLGFGDLGFALGQRRFALSQFRMGGGDPAVALGQPFGLLGEQALAIVEAALPAFGVLPLLPGSRGELRDLALAGTAGGRSRLFGDLLGLAMGAVNERLRLGAGGRTHPPGFLTGGARLGLRCGRLGTGSRRRSACLLNCRAGVLGRRAQ
jgi:hypothetical protein